MADSIPESSALALGRLIGTVEGLVRAIDEQNKTSAARKKEQDEATVKSREEFMQIFQGMREDSKANQEALAEHIKEDLVYHGAMQEFATWKKDVEPKVDTLWDSKNRAQGAIVASGTIGSILGGTIVAVVEYFKKG